MQAPSSTPRSSPRPRFEALGNCDAIARASFTPTKKFEKCHANIDDPWQVESLPPLVRWVLDCKAIAFDRQRDSGGGYLCESEWTNVFVWANDPVEARRHIEARLAEARAALATWVVKS